MSDSRFWRPISMSPEEPCGWYLGVVLPVNHREVPERSVRSWVRKYGCQLVWYNACSIDKWWLCDPLRRLPAISLKGRITHWAETPEVPDEYR